MYKKCIVGHEKFWINFVVNVIFLVVFVYFSFLFRDFMQNTMKIWPNELLYFGIIVTLGSMAKYLVDKSVNRFWNNFSK